MSTNLLLSSDLRFQLWSPPCSFSREISYIIDIRACARLRIYRNSLFYLVFRTHTNAGAHSEHSKLKVESRKQQVMCDTFIQWILGEDWPVVSFFSRLSHHTHTTHNKIDQWTSKKLENRNTIGCLLRTMCSTKRGKIACYTLLRSIWLVLKGRK